MSRTADCTNLILLPGFAEDMLGRKLQCGSKSTCSDVAIAQCQLQQAEKWQRTTAVAATPEAQPSAVLTGAHAFQLHIASEGAWQLKGMQVEALVIMCSPSQTCSDHPLKHRGGVQIGGAKLGL